MLKKPVTKKGWWSGARCRPSVQAPVPQKKKKKRKRENVPDLQCLNISNFLF
jgi:hypothetical protein